MFTVQLKNGDRLQVPLEALEEFVEKNRDSASAPGYGLRIQVQHHHHKVGIADN
ncbi:MAG: hypothetical protein KME01_06655 [Chroococcus sp. CMT-3BRIN-NPC107]|jgi:hypothetical protein|nr:hypothetical protein [Chroococcus sp. CMT-3BRIN-NPC107]